MLVQDLDDDKYFPKSCQLDCRLLLAKQEIETDRIEIPISTHPMNPSTVRLQLS